MNMDKGLHLAYNNSQWMSTFNDDFPINPCKLGRNEGFYHYTSLNNALKILNQLPENNDFAEDKNKYISLFASHFLFLNDAAELLDGLDSVLSVLENKFNSLNESNDDIIEAKNVLGEYLELFRGIRPNQIHNAPNHFIICFCRDGNYLPQWEYYGKDCGIAIEFDLYNCEYDGLTSFCKEKPNLTIPVTPRKILYKENEKKNIIDKLNSFTINDVEDAVLFAIRSIAVASFMKHPAFSEEKEVRLLFSPLFFTGIDSYADTFNLTNFRESNGIIKPYMEIHIKNKVIRKTNKTPIKSVTVGPGNNQKLVYNGIIRLIQAKFENNFLSIPKSYELPQKNLEVTKIGNIEVRRSTIPFRG